jgi:hypothetical protein
VCVRWAWCGSCNARWNSEPHLRLIK